MSGSGVKSFRVANALIALFPYIRMPEVGSLIVTPVVIRIRNEIKFDPSIRSDVGLGSVMNRDPITMSEPD